MTHPVHMSVGELAEQLAPITGNSAAFHARQLRAQIREGVLTPSMRGGSGVTAPALFDETGLCRALVLHNLASIGQEMGALKDAATAMGNVAPTARKGDTTEPSDGIAFAMNRARNGAEVFLHLEFSTWPATGQEDRSVSGWITDSSLVSDSPIMRRRAWIVIPLHTVLKPLLG